MARGEDMSCEFCNFNVRSAEVNVVGHTISVVLLAHTISGNAIGSHNFGSAICPHNFRQRYWLIQFPATLLAHTISGNTSGSHNFQQHYCPTQFPALPLNFRQCCMGLCNALCAIGPNRSFVVLPTHI